MKNDVKLSDFVQKTRVFYTKTLVFGLFLAVSVGLMGVPKA